jgi:hypothetical protein
LYSLDFSTTKFQGDIVDSIFSEPYRSPRTLSLLAIGFLAASLIIDLLFVFVGAAQLAFPIDIPLKYGDARDTMPLWLLAIGMLEILDILVYISCIVFFLLWLYRCYKNLPALKAGRTEYTPGWAVGWWFIPIANLFKPFGAVRDLWNESDPNFDSELNFMSLSVGSPTLLHWWWAFWLLGNVASNISSRIGHADDTTELQSFSIALIIASLFGIVAAALAILVVKNITKRQEARFSRMSDFQPQLTPPPPPKFG